ncbi:tRNA-binding protein [Flavobacteriales bacterium]|nr:tRNA-binding protein [Flavobacteriales bacterium]
METINWDDFCKIDLRTGTITAVEEFKEARNPAYKLLIDFGELGIKKSSAQITTLYQPEDLIGTQIIAVVNFPKKQIGTFMSECLVLGIQEQANVVLITTERMAKNGVKIS